MTKRLLAVIVAILIILGVVCGMGVYRSKEMSPTYHKTYSQLEKELLYARVKVLDTNRQLRDYLVIRDKEQLITMVREFDRLRETSGQTKFSMDDYKNSYVVVVWREGRSVSHVIKRSGNTYFYENIRVWPHQYVKVSPDLVELLQLFGS